MTKRITAKSGCRGDTLIVWRYLKRYWYIVVIIALLTIVSTYFELLIPDCLSKFLGTVEIDKGFTDIALLIVLAVFATLVVSLVIAYLTGRLLSSVSNDMRDDVFEKISNFSEKEMSKFTVSSLTTRTVNDITHIQQVTGLMLIAFMKTPVMYVMALMKITGIGLSWTLILICYSVALIVAITICMLTVIPQLTKLQKYMDEITTVNNDSLTGLCEVRSYNGERFQHERYNAVNRKITDSNSVIQQSLATTNAFVPICINTITVVIYMVAANMINGYSEIIIKGEMLNSMIVFSTYASMVFSALIMLFNSLFFYPKARIAGKRVEEILMTELSMKNGTFRKDCSEKGHIVFEDVSFRYQGNLHDTVWNINLDVKPGQTLGIIGQTGSGKSTLVNLIPRIYDVTGGLIKIDGIDVRDYDIDKLHSKIGFVPQKSILLKRSICDNVKFGNTSELRTQENVRDAVRIANAKDFVETYNDGYDHMVQERGSNLSGGQKQRICIARAICRRPEIYIFDDCFSSLDFKTDYCIRKTLREETAGITTIIVSHRICTIINADKIVLMDKGRIIGMGAHEEMMDSCEKYREIYRLQFPEGDYGE